MHINFLFAHQTINAVDAASGDSKQVEDTLEYLRSVLEDPAKKTELLWNKATQVLCLHLVASTSQRPGVPANLTVEEYMAKDDDVQLVDDIDEEASTAPAEKVAGEQVCNTSVNVIYNH